MFKPPRYINFFNTHCSSKNSRNSDAVLQVSLNKRMVLAITSSASSNGQVFLPNQRSLTHYLFIWVLFSCPAQSLRTETRIGGPKY